jgi:hypothetical membrane protein
MKKAVMAVLWVVQYLLAAAAIWLLYHERTYLWLIFFTAAYFLLPAAGKVLGITPAVQKDYQARAAEAVPPIIEVMWKFACFVCVIIFTLAMVKPESFQIPLTAVHALIIFYVGAAIRDLFTIKVFAAYDFSN